MPKNEGTGAVRKENGLGMKQGPPTPLECWKALKRVSEAWKTGTHAPMQMIVDYIELKMLKRFSAEALERDEKRRAALEKVYFWATKLHDKMQGAAPTPMPVNVGDFYDIYLIRKELDALTQATQEKE